MNSLLSLIGPGMHLIFYVTMLVFVIFTVFLGYHWFTYGSDKKISSLALAVFLIVSAPLFLTMAVALLTVPV
jgi:hypothetical protein